MVVLSFVKYSNIHNAINFTFPIPYHAYLDIFYRLLRTFSSGPLRFCQQKPFSSLHWEGDMGVWGLGEPGVRYMCTEVFNWLAVTVLQ